MWRSLVDWALAFFGIARELDEHRQRIASLEKEVRDLQEGLKLFALESKHRRELDAAEREKLELKLANALALKALPAKRSRKGQS